jgi:parallel beta-helix repeat protein
MGSKDILFIGEHPFKILIQGGKKVNKKPLIGVSICAVVLLVLGSLSNVVGYQTVQTPTSRGNWLYVGGSGPGNYTRIQDAIDNATDGDTVFVYNGIYYENIILDKSINLTGEIRETTIIDANYYGSSICLRNSSGIMINGFTFQHSGMGLSDNAGINFDYMGNGIFLNKSMIFNNIIKENWNGIWIDACENSRFYDNLIEENYNNGFYGVGSLFNSIVFNNIIRNNGNYGMYLQVCDNNEIKNNIIENNSFMNIRLYHCLENLIINNYVANSECGIFVDDRCWLNQIINNNFIQNEVGLLIETAHFSSVKKNNFIDNSVHAWFIAQFFWAPATTRWAGNYWSNSTKPMKIKGEIHIEIPNFIEPYGDPFIIPISWIQFDMFPAKEPYDI